MLDRASDTFHELFEFIGLLLLTRLPVDVLDTSNTLFSLGFAGVLVLL